MAPSGPPPARAKAIRAGGDDFVFMVLRLEQTGIQQQRGRCRACALNTTALMQFKTDRAFIYTGFSSVTAAAAVAAAGLRAAVFFAAGFLAAVLTSTLAGAGAATGATALALAGEATF